MLKMELLVIVDQDLEDFAGDAAHDVLFERTPYVSYFTRNFKDVFSWGNYDDFMLSLDQTNDEYIAGKHRFYRRLFLEPIVYHDEITEDEQDYVKRFYPAIENNILKYTGYEFERYKQSYILVKTQVVTGEVLHPAENMLSNLILRFGGFLLENQKQDTFSFSNTLEISNNEMKHMLASIKESDAHLWSKSFKEMSSEQLRIQVTDYLINWNFADRIDDKTVLIKEGLFRIVGTYDAEAKKEEQA
jgi:uncharacterized protein (TIGR02678 family)